MTNAQAKSRGEAKVPSFPLSKPRHRIVAGMFDIAILILGSIIIMIPSIIVFIGAMHNPSDWRTFSVYLVMFLTGAVVASFSLAYRVGVPHFYQGQTLGLRFFKMKMLKENGDEVGVKEVLVKSVSIFFLVIFTLGLYYLVEALALCLSKNKRSFADTVSKTIVVDVDDGDE
ncbi:MAG: RDD family protein [Bacilli bacterium]|jgi:uncharacterized RDD family membrane protein YckC|nr:RDD family protein [Bacilli bacterium]MCH4228770.1 RDD family protein [Bacilli bacterium]MCH4278364.1 RDD family protein [Bacilli bacterium]MCI2055067.1 RDD family protein [Bacilli bacterium]